MIVKKKAKPRRSAGGKRAHATDWRAAVRRHLSKVPEVDAVFVSMEEATVHVYAVVEQIHKTDYRRLMRAEDQIEKAFPHICFEFHAWPHQGRNPREAGPYGAELVYLR